MVIKLQKKKIQSKWSPIRRKKKLIEICYTILIQGRDILKEKKREKRGFTLLAIVVFWRLTIFQSVYIFFCLKKFFLLSITERLVVFSSLLWTTFTKVPHFVSRKLNFFHLIQLFFNSKHVIFCICVFILLF